MLWTAGGLWLLFGLGILTGLSVELAIWLPNRYKGWWVAVGLSAAAIAFCFILESIGPAGGA